MVRGGMMGSEKRMKWQVEEEEEVGLCVVGGGLLA